MGYFGVGTSQNRALWAIFICCFLAGAVLLPLGWAKLAPCVKNYNDCIQEFYPRYEDLCRAARDNCAASWARVWVAGVILLILSCVPLFVFSCCAKPPEVYAAAMPTATFMNTYPPGTYQPYPASPYTPAPGATYTGVPVSGQPVMYAAVPQDGTQVVYAVVTPQGGGQPGAYHYPAPPPATGGGGYPYLPPPVGEPGRYPPPQAAGPSPPVQV